MLLAEVEPKSSTHSASCELSTREISPIPLDRRVIFCLTAGLAVWFEELLKNFITLSETDAINTRSQQREARASVTKTRLPPPFLPLSEYRPSPSGRRPLRWRCA